MAVWRVKVLCIYGFGEANLENPEVPIDRIAEC